MVFPLDTVNATLLLGGGILQATSVRQAWIDKRVAGVTWYATALYLAWDLSTAAIYWRDAMWLSLAAMVFAIAAGAAWVWLAIWYGRIR